MLELLNVYNVAFIGRIYGTNDSLVAYKPGASLHSFAALRHRYFHWFSHLWIASDWSITVSGAK